mmetsp:Transcript_33966/g.94024  ORF Transcript_33966/g.94024 Transcript_33966/m.94024 type:complete len:148 (-) Transcript_33966:682-1125(-)
MPKAMGIRAEASGATVTEFVQGLVRTQPVGPIAGQEGEPATSGHLSRGGTLADASQEGGVAPAAHGRVLMRPVGLVCAWQGEHGPSQPLLCLCVGHAWLLGAAVERGTERGASGASPLATTLPQSTLPERPRSKPISPKVTTWRGPA